MSATRQMGDLMAFAAQGKEHLELVKQLFATDAPPESALVEQVTAATRALRGSASLLGLDSFQGFLGRLFQLLEDVKTSEVPWSSRLRVVLRAAAESEARHLAAIDRGETSSDAQLVHDEEHLASWRRNEAKRFEQPATADDSQHAMSQSAASGVVEQQLHDLIERVQEIRASVESQPVNEALVHDLAQLSDEFAALLEEIRAKSDKSSNGPGGSEDGLRNHCEGGLRQLVEAAAREVLDEASERQVRLGIRATGALDAVDDELGGALLEILRNLWSDSLVVQAPHGEVQIDTVFRVDSERLLIEIRDPELTREQSQRSDEDILGRYAGLRRSRRLMEALQGLVQAEPQSIPGCRFRLALPYSTEVATASVVRVGVQEIAIPASAISSVHSMESVHVRQDQAGTYVEIDGARFPILHLAFVMSDVSYDELVRKFVVVVGSFERRAALFVSELQQGIRGERQPGPSGPWVGTLASEQGHWPLLDVGALLGRRAQQPAARTKSASSERSEKRTTQTVLVVNSSEVEREALSNLLVESAYRTIVAQSPSEALEALANQPVDLVICDLRLPDMHAQQIAEHRTRTGRFADVPMLLVLSQASEQSHLVVQQLGAVDAVRSPVQPEELRSVVKRLTEGS